MDPRAAADYLSKLLGRTIAIDTPLRLSSAQRARFNAWMHERGWPRRDKALAAEFTIGSLAEGATALVAAPAATVERASADIDLAVGGGGLAIGVDIQPVDELLAGVNRHDFKADVTLARLFTARELSYAQARPDPSQTLTGLFAAKEAIRKCTGGAPLEQSAFQALEVLPDEHGQPTSPGFAISVSHAAGFAIAVACRTVAVPGESARESAPAPSNPQPAPAAAASGFTASASALYTLLGILVSLHCLLLYRMFF